MSVSVYGHVPDADGRAGEWPHNAGWHPCLPDCSQYWTLQHGWSFTFDTWLHRGRAGWSPWLRVPEWMQYKITVLPYKVLYDSAPQYQWLLVSPTYVDSGLCSHQLSDRAICPTVNHWPCGFYLGRVKKNFSCKISCNFIDSHHLLLMFPHQKYFLPDFFITSESLNTAFFPTRSTSVVLAVVYLLGPF